MEAISGEVKEAKANLDKLHSESHDKREPCQIAACILAAAFRRERAMRMKVEALLVWVAKGKQGPSPSIFLDDYLAAIDAELK